MPPPVILASTSEFRQQTFCRLGIDFKTAAPEIDERRHDNEDTLTMALRLAQEKVAAVIAQYPDCIVIGGDQVLDLAGKDYGKPLTLDNAIAQLTALSGQSGVFHCGMAVTYQEQQWNYSIPTEVTWRTLSQAEIANYVAREPSLKSAGAAQLEKMGICLVDKMTSDDPTAILGMPLISIGNILRELGWQIPPPS